MPDLLVEAVCCSADDCVEAEAGGADRIELCGELVVGGLTPSLGTLIEARASTRLPIVQMIRPRAGGFCYTPREFATMRRDAALALAHGADGIVFGVLRENGEIDVERCREMVAIARESGRPAGPGPPSQTQAPQQPRQAQPPPPQTVFHRAFDVVPEPFAALETLIALGVTRILTSGRQPTAVAGAALIRELAGRAGGRIEILPGGGIREATVADVLRATGIRAVHLAPFRPQPDTSGQANPALSFSGLQIPAEGTYPLSDREALRRVRAAAEWA
jgi:copper homeostasis protein